METHLYKIQHKITQLFSRGGMGVSKSGTGSGWNRSGKVWTNLGHLRNHLSQYVTTHNSDQILDWQVITYAVTVEKVIPAVEALSAASIVRMLKSQP
jgi:hypothetical protein